MRLLESNAIRRRARGGTAASILVHVAVIGAAVAATASAHVLDTSKVPMELPRYVAQVLERAPVAPRDRHSGPSSWTPDIPIAPPRIDSDVICALRLPLPGFNPDSVLANSFPGPRVELDGADGPRASEGDGPLTENLVERAAMPIGQVRPRYPDALREAGIGGRVVLRFVVDTLGRVEPATVETVSATDPRFGEAARRAIGGLHFSPAEARGRRVRQLVEVPFEFQIQ